MCRKQLIEHQTTMHALPSGQAFADLLAAEGLITNELRGNFNGL
jgi:hypothetical protein